jgi:DMSO/TMAO reductase YedYZ heme-binding membrane subunit
MAFLITLVGTIAAAFVLKSPLKRFPWMFYILAVAVCGVGLWLFFLPAAQRPAFLTGFSLIMRRGYIALSLFALVMFVGAFDDDSLIRRTLQPIRAELSIIASILIVGHFLPYLMGYMQQLTGLVLIRTNIVISLGISLALLILLVPLTVTSFTVVKRRMRPAIWKKLQKLAYVFFLLVYVHLTAFLLPSAIQGSPTALTSVAIYSVIFLAYLALRVLRVLQARRVSIPSAAEHRLRREEG